MFKYNRRTWHKPTRRTILPKLCGTQITWLRFLCEDRELCNKPRTNEKETIILYILFSEIYVKWLKTIGSKNCPLQSILFRKTKILIKSDLCRYYFTPFLFSVLNWQVECTFGKKVARLKLFSNSITNAEKTHLHTFTLHCKTRFHLHFRGHPWW